MSAEWQVQSAESWKLSLACTRAEADALLDDIPALAAFDPPPVVMTSEPDEARPDRWRIDVYVEGPPSPELVAAVGGLAAGGRPTIEKLEDEDWVTSSQAFLKPLTAGRFFIHTAIYADEIPAGKTPFLIEASRAFGTGHHETTAGCLEMLDRLATGGARFGSIADIGTGTGLLAFAARALWPGAHVIATDIDPVSIEVAAVNMQANIIPAKDIALVTAPGVDDPAIEKAAPFDLLIANILAGPLIALAPDFAIAAAPGGSVMLAGLLGSQEAAVVAAFEACGWLFQDRLQRGDWPTLLLVYAR